MNGAAELELRPIEPGDRLTGLSIGDPEFQALKRFIQQHAKRYHDNNLARTYGLFSDTPKLVGYITLVCGEVETSGIAQVGDELGYRYPHFPALKIARLLIDARLRGQDWGRQLVQFAVGTAKGVICPVAGCRFVVVDAKKASVGFYERCGFTMLDTADNRQRAAPVMFLDLAKV